MLHYKSITNVKSRTFMSAYMKAIYQFHYGTKKWIFSLLHIHSLRYSKEDLPFHVCNRTRKQSPSMIHFLHHKLFAICIHKYYENLFLCANDFMSKDEERKGSGGETTTTTTPASWNVMMNVEYEKEGRRWKWAEKEIQ